MRMLFFTFIAITLVCVSCGSNPTIKMIKLNYSAASAIEYLNRHYYIMGDDSRNLMILDNTFTEIDSISLYASTKNRIPKNDKADIESMTVTKDNKLLLLGSGSLTPQRNGGWLIDPLTKQTDSIRLDTIYKRFKAAGIKELNIEGVCSIPGSILMANRGNNKWRRNDLIVLKEDFLANQSTTPFTYISIGVDTSTAFTGISGLAYASQSDQLLITVSTENTSNNIEDGVIGKSYLWIIKNISSKKGSKVLSADIIIDLEELDAKFATQKIESVCVTNETTDSLELTFAADNDDGSSSFFRIELKNN